jgi:hypothetical protein
MNGVPGKPQKERTKDVLGVARTFGHRSRAYRCAPVAKLDIPPG